MSKETSADIAKLGSRAMREPETLKLDEIQSLGASVVSQREEDPGVSARLEDDTAFGQFIFQNLRLVVAPTERNAFELGQAIKRYLTTGE